MLKFLVILSLAAAATLTATPVTADLSLCNSGLCAIDDIDPGTILARVVAQDVSGGINFTISTLNSGWLLWDGGLFGFNAPAGGNLVLPEGYTAAGRGNEDGFGVYEYRINGPAKGGLAEKGVRVFSFVVKGLQTWQIFGNENGHRFAAHIGVPNGTCGGNPCDAVTGFVTETAAEIPEPGTLTLFGCSLIGASWLARGKWRR